ncbi:MAG: type IV pilus modification PilV family protein [bacterium]
MTLWRRRQVGFSTLEVLVSLFLIVLVVTFTWRTIGVTLALLGSGNRSDQKAARLRTQASGWIQAVSEYTRAEDVGFGVCTALTPPCSYWIPAGGAPYSVGPTLPAGFQCGHVLIDYWDPGAPAEWASLRLVTVEVYRARSSCTDAGVGTAYLLAHTGVAVRE